MPEQYKRNTTQHRISRRSVMAAAAIGPVIAAFSANTAGGQAASANGKVALVTGSSRGIGAATAKQLARDGYSVTVNCVVNRDLAANVVRDIEAEGGEAIWEQADVRDPAAVHRLFDANDRAFGGVDVVVSNAGIMPLANFAKMTNEDFDRVMAVNVKGSFNVMREAARRVRDHGRIITLSSSITQLRSPTYGPTQPRKQCRKSTPIFSPRSWPAG